MSTKKDTAPTKPRERKVAPGVVERHTVACDSRRRARSSCTCRPTYRARVRVGPRGEQRNITDTFSTLAEAVEWTESVKATVRAGGEAQAPRKPAPPLGIAAGQFLARALAGKTKARGGRNYATTTITNYETALRVHALPFVSERTGIALEDTPADAIDTRMMQAMVDHIALSSPGMARLAEAAVGAVLRDLYRREVLEVVPARPELPAPPDGRERTITPEEADALLAAAVDDDARTGRSLMAPLVAVLVGTGCRVSEVLGLTWGPQGVDLDADHPTVTIVRATTKTDAGGRRIGLEPDYAAVLRQHRLATGRPEDGSRVFCDEGGGALTRDGRVRSGLRRITRTAGLEGIAFHVLRHSQGSWLASAGESATDIAARLGHSDPAFTLRRYVHADRERLAQAPAALARLRAEHRQAGEANGIG